MSQRTGIGSTGGGMTAGATLGGDASQRVAIDPQSLEALKHSAQSSPQQAVKGAVKQFDAVFMQMMLKSMRDATPSNGLLDSNDGNTFTSMLDQQLSQQLSARGVGMADKMLGQMMRLSGGAQAGASAATIPGGMPPGGATGLASGGSASSTASVRAYQQSARLSARAFDADQPTLRGTGGSAHANAFIDKLGASAQAASQTTGIPARFILSQAALESGWGKREILNADGSSSHNVFGVKAGKSWTGKTVDATTTEYVNGQAHTVKAKFRAYDSYQDAMEDYTKVLTTNPRYQPVVEAAGDAAGFAHGLQRAGYATDPQYAKKLISIMKQMA
jgi:flagellar protein FlgJ